MDSIVETLVEMTLGQNKKKTDEFVGTTFVGGLPFICFFREQLPTMAVGQRWSAQVAADRRNGRSGYLVVHPQAQVLNSSFAATELQSVVRRQPESSMRVAESAAVRVVMSRPAITVRVGAGTYSVREGHWYFFPVGRKHDRFAVCRWAFGAADPVLESQEIQGYQALFDAVAAARGNGYIVWWPEKWDQQGQGVKL